MQRLIPLDELLQIVTDAGLLHQRAFYETSLSKLIANGSDPLTELSTAYEVGAALGIPEEKIKAVLAGDRGADGERSACEYPDRV